jgi:hypothetical protein
MIFIIFLIYIRVHIGQLMNQMKVIIINQMLVNEEYEENKNIQFFSNIYLN